MARARAMRIQAALPHDLCNYVIEMAVHLYNLSRTYSHDWQTPY